MSITTEKKTYAPKRSKDVGGLTLQCPPRPFTTLSDLLLTAHPAPTNTVSLIVERPSMNTRNIILSTTLQPDIGMPNSGWAERENIGYNDQLCTMSTHAIRTITGGDDHVQWSAAGDQMFLDFDMEPLQVGEEVTIGEALCVVSAKEHTGCIKFKTRYGDGAMKIVACKEGRGKRLRGMYFWVKEGGVVNVGDKVERVNQPDTGSSTCCVM